MSLLERTPIELLLIRRIAALEALCAHYRTGTQPSETLHRELEFTKGAADELRKPKS